MNARLASLTAVRSGKLSRSIVARCPVPITIVHQSSGDRSGCHRFSVITSSGSTPPTVQHLPEMLGIGDLVPRMKCFVQLGSCFADRLPKRAIRRLKYIGSPRRDRQLAARTDETPEFLD